MYNICVRVCVCVCVCVCVYYISKVLWDPNLDADYYKIYPTAVTPFTKIQEWYLEGRYAPYADEDGGSKLIDLLVWFKEHVQEWKRINRVALLVECVLCRMCSL